MGVICVFIGKRKAAGFWQSCVETVGGRQLDVAVVVADCRRRRTTFGREQKK
jgi:hypothetical protein